MRTLALTVACSLAISSLSWSAPASADFRPPPPPRVEEKSPPLLGKHHASALQKFGIGAGVCEGVAIGATIVVERRLLHSNELALITVKCIAVGAASLVPVVGVVVVAVVIIDDLLLDSQLLGPVFNPLANLIEPLFRPFDPAYGETAKASLPKKHGKKSKKRPARALLKPALTS